MTTPLRSAPFALCSTTWAVVVWVLTAGAAAAQKDVDPYTGGDPAKVAAAGYRSVGPCAWADGHDTEDIRAIMVGGGLHVVETDHFRVASALGPRDLPPTTRGRERLRQDLDEMRKRLPAIPAKVTRLDPWLLTHLYAHRCEQLYAELAERFGVDDDDFPMAGAPRRPEHLGRGPHLGRPERFLLLMFETEGDLVRYLSTYTDRTEHVPVRHHYVQSDSLGYVLNADAHRGVLQDEEHLHANVTFSIVLNLVDGFGTFDPEVTPLWLREGIAHWYRRRVHVEHNNFSHFDDRRADEFKAWQWYSKVHARVDFGVDPSPRLVRQWRDPGALTLVEHAMMWSRVDYLFTLEAEGFHRFWRHVEAHALTPGNDDEERLAWHDRAFTAGWGFDTAAFEKGWKAYVLANYPGKE